MSDVQEVVCAVFYASEGITSGAFKFSISPRELAKNNDEQLGALLRHRIEATRPNPLDGTRLWDAS